MTSEQQQKPQVVFDGFEVIFTRPHAVSATPLYDDQGKFLGYHYTVTVLGDP